MFKILVCHENTLMNKNETKKSELRFAFTKSCSLVLLIKTQLLSCACTAVFISTASASFHIADNRAPLPEIQDKVSK